MESAVKQFQFLDAEAEEAPIVAETATIIPANMVAIYYILQNANVYSQEVFSLFKCKYQIPIKIKNNKTSKIKGQEVFDDVLGKMAPIHLQQLLPKVGHQVRFEEQRKQ